MDGWTDRQIDVKMNGQNEGRKDGSKNGSLKGWIVNGWRERATERP